MVRVDRQLALLRQLPGEGRGNRVLGERMDGRRLPVEGRVPCELGEVGEALRIDPAVGTEESGRAQLVERGERDGGVGIHKRCGGGQGMCSLLVPFVLLTRGSRRSRWRQGRAPAPSLLRLRIVDGDAQLEPDLRSKAFLDIAILTVGFQSDSLGFMDCCMSLTLWRSTRNLMISRRSHRLLRLKLACSLRRTVLRNPYSRVTQRGWICRPRSVAFGSRGLRLMAR